MFNNKTEKYYIISRDQPFWILTGTLLLLLLCYLDIFASFFETLSIYSPFGYRNRRPNAVVVGRPQILENLDSRINQAKDE